MERSRSGGDSDMVKWNVIQVFSVNAVDANMTKMCTTFASQNKYSFRSIHYSTLDFYFHFLSIGIVRIRVCDVRVRWRCPFGNHHVYTHLVSKLYCGRLINNHFGKKLINTVLTHGAIRCVCGDRKCTLSTTTVTHILFVWWGRREANENKRKLIIHRWAIKIPAETI